MNFKIGDRVKCIDAKWHGVASRRTYFIMNLQEEMEMKGFSESLQIELNESLSKLQGERKVKATRLMHYIEWSATTIEELKVMITQQNQEIQNLKEMLD